MNCRSVKIFKKLGKAVMYGFAQNALTAVFRRFKNALFMKTMFQYTKAMVIYLVSEMNVFTSRCPRGHKQYY